MKFNNFLINEIIEVFEDFLDEKGIVIPNEDKEEDAGASNIYGMDYARLQCEIRDALNSHGIMAEDEW